MEGIGHGNTYSRKGRLEGDLKKIFPADSDRVASDLSATRANRQSPAEDPVPAPIAK